MATNDFIERAQKVHGNKYDYSLVEYINSKTKVIIICKKHGQFMQVPVSHINRGSNCPKCAIIYNTTKRRLNFKQFIQKSQKVHGDKYDYSLVEYINNKTNVKIICPMHGIFMQLPYNHISGHNCPKCALNCKLTIEFFIERANNVHGNKYDYSLVNYINSITKVKIICPKHGEFMQRPYRHISGQNCPNCPQIISNYKLTTETFIETANNVHNNKYNYSLVEYINCRTKVKIICSVHGLFMQTPDNHIYHKIGCIKCARNYKLTTETFIEKAKMVHGSKYGYSLVEYINNKTKVQIICYVHGLFMQRPDMHLSGYNCIKCKYNKYN